MSWKKAFFDQGIKEFSRARSQARDIASTALQTQNGQRLVNAARAAAQNGPVKQIAALCGKAGVAGAIVDGALGSMQAAKAIQDGRLTIQGGVKHACAEAGCGFVTSSSGTAGTLAVYMVTGAMGPAALAAGMGASMGSRWAYRQVVGETLPEQRVDTGDDDDKSSGLEEIGPRPQDSDE